ncbi:MAG: Na(+)-translocating NADH-quinone reductase subunit A [Flavobacteriales bacterium]|jgi:Na+-transporting NADH:ubiquinone oxidoreductase subunit A
MSRIQRIRKGADIRLEGRPADTVSEAPSAHVYAVKPPDFIGVVTKLAVRVGDNVKAGSTIFYDKKSPSVKYSSPVAGTIKDIVRGAKRRVLAIEIEADSENSYCDFGVLDVSKSNRDQILSRVLESGMFPFFRQRPFDVVANPDDLPRSIHVSAFDSSPLAASTFVALDGRLADFQIGIDALAKLAGEGGVHLGLRSSDTTLAGVKNCHVTYFEGPHPAGNVGVQIHHTAPLNKGVVVWTISPQDVANLGTLLKSGKYIPSRVVACGGSECKNPQHVLTLSGASISSIVDVPSKAHNGDEVRVISGSPLTGDQVSKDGYLGAYHSAIALLPEGHDPKFLLTTGWLGLGLGRFSLSKSFLTWLMPKSKAWPLDTNMGGEERAFVVSGQYEKVFPMDIHPVHLVKSIVVNDIDSMEKLGIYEVAPEDFALCEYGCTSKIPVQKIVREGLDNLRNELG